jgi:hypothetical protein
VREQNHVRKLPNDFWVLFFGFIFFGFGFAVGLIDTKPIVTEPKSKAWLMLFCCTFIGATSILAGFLVRGKFSPDSDYVGMILISPFAFLSIAHALRLYEQVGGPFLFSPDCGPTSMSDYCFYVLDNIAKGAILDFFQSFDINLWRCPPRRGSFAVGVINFALRTFTTYVVIWAAVRIVTDFRLRASGK